MQLNFNPLTNGIQSKPFNSLNDLAPFAQKITGQQEVMDRYNQVPWNTPQKADTTQVPLSRDGLQSFPMQQTLPEPGINVDSIMKGIDNSLVPKMNADTLADTNEIAGDDKTLETANRAGFGTASAILGQGNPLLMGLGAAGGIINGLLANKARTEELRRREIEVEQALAQNQSEREKIDMLNPNANFRAKMGMMQDGRSQAMQQAANVGGASVASSGLGGDVGSAKIAAMKASAPMSQAGAMFDQQMAGAVDQKTAEENQIIGQLSNNTMQRGQLSQMTDYITKEKNKSPFTGIMSSALAGMTGMSMMSDMVGGEKDVKLTPGK